MCFIYGIAKMHSGWINNMKKYFLIICMFICVFCFGLSVSFFYFASNGKQEKELLVYRNGNPIQDSISVVDEEVVEKLQKEHSQIDIKTDEANENEADTISYDWYGTSIYIENLMPGTEYVVVLEYLNLKSPILEALLYEPDYSRAYSKDGLSSEGKLVFPLTQDKEGMYTIVFYGAGDLGGFTSYIIEREEFVNLQEPNVEYPRDLMREDAVIDE